MSLDTKGNLGLANLLLGALSALLAVPFVQQKVSEQDLSQETHRACAHS